MNAQKNVSFNLSYEHEIITHNGVRGVFVPEADYRTLITVFDLYHVQIRELSYYNDLFHSKTFKNIRITRDIFKISTQILSVSFLISIGVIALLGVYIYRFCGTP